MAIVERGDISESLPVRCCWEEAHCYYVFDKIGGSVVCVHVLVHVTVNSPNPLHSLCVYVVSRF